MRKVPSFGRQEGTRPSATSHAFLIPAVTKVFEDLRIGASLWQPGRWPLSLHDEPQSLVAFDYLHGVANERYEYNDRIIAQVCRTRRTVVGVGLLQILDYSVDLVVRPRRVA